MKKKSLLIATLLVVVAATVAVVSCKKEKQGQISNNNEQIVQDVGNMDEYLISFKKKLLSAQKGDETISLEQAQRDLGNLLNFDFGDANYATDVFQHDTLYTKLSLTNGEVDLSQLADTYKETISKVLNVYENIDIPEKSIYVIVCNFNEVESKDGDYEDVEIIIVTRGYTGVSDYPHNTYDWRPTNRGGTCDGLLVGVYGGPEVMTDWLNYTIEPLACINGGRLYYTNVDISIKLGSDTEDPDNPGTYKIYYSTYPYQNNVCISHAIMEYYYSNILAYWNSGDFYPVIPSNHVAIVFYVDHIPSYYGGNPNIPYMWKVTVKHGIFNCTDTEPLT